MKKYEKPEAELVKFVAEDVLATDSTPDTGHDTDFMD